MNNYQSFIFRSPLAILIVFAYLSVCKAADISGLNCWRLTANSPSVCKAADISGLKAHAEQGHADEQHLLGVRYHLGDGVPKDYVEAVRWYRLAAEKGHTGAQRSLGFCYQRGEGVPKDLVQAYAWFNIEAAQGSGKGNRERIAERMTPAQIEEAQKLSREYWETYGLGRENN